MNDGLEKDCCHEEVVDDVEAGDHQPPMRH